jgi:hypothetical protein
MPHFEKRKQARRRVGVQAKIVPLDKGRKAGSCTVVDLSSTGARLSVGNPLSVPAEFTLMLPNMPAGHNSQIAWRSRSEVGVRFVRGGSAPSVPSFGKRPIVVTPS